MGIILAIQYIIGQINAPLISLVNFLREIQDAKLSVERFTNIDYKSDNDKMLKDLIWQDYQKLLTILQLTIFPFRYGGCFHNNFRI